MKTPPFAKYIIGLTFCIVLFSTFGEATVLLEQRHISYDNPAYIVCVLGSFVALALALRMLLALHHTAEQTIKRLRSPLSESIENDAHGSNKSDKTSD
jgi:hypothetical protein